MTKLIRISLLFFFILLGTFFSNMVIAQATISYVSGSNNPYIIYKLTDLNILAFGVGHTSKIFPYGESYTILPKIFGYKNFNSGVTYAFNQVTNMEVTY